MPLELTEQELQDKIAAAVTIATSGLINKRDELLGKIDRYKTDALAADKLKADAVEAERQAQLTAEGKHEEVLNSVRTQMQATIDDQAVKLTEATTTGTKATEDLRSLLVDSGLKDLYHSAGVTNPHLLRAIVDSSAKNAVIDYDTEGKPIVKIGEKIIGEYITTWKTTEEGKSFITDGNSGGGGGNDGDGGSTDDYEAFFQEGTVNLTKQNELKTKDEDRYNTLKKQYTKEKNLPFSAVPRGY